MADKLKKRDLHCWHCGEVNDLVIHHRVNRGMGGSKKLDTLQNLMRVCPEVNFLMESDSEVAEQAREFGWKLSRFNKEPQPVFDKTSGFWFTLTEGGDKIAAEREEGLF
jgi:hypothetical protein